MDDDDMRRGNPPCHLASAGESLAAKKLEQHTLQSMAAPFLAKLCPSIPVPNSFERKIALAFHIADDILDHTATENFARKRIRREAVEKGTLLTFLVLRVQSHIPMLSPPKPPVHWRFSAIRLRCCAMQRGLSLNGNIKRTGEFANGA